MTIIGDAVNLAARIEAATKATSAHVLVSAATVAALGAPERGWAAHRVALPGKSGEFVLYQMLDAP